MMKENPQTPPDEPQAPAAGGQSFYSL
jgi:hypothetical protein